VNELVSFKNIFKDRIFKIPDYQRGYAWTTRQLKDFWEVSKSIKNPDVMALKIPQLNLSFFYFL